jgi:hypothetical protein
MAISDHLFRRQTPEEAAATRYEYDSIDARREIRDRAPEAEAALEDVRDNFRRPEVSAVFVDNAIKRTNVTLARIIEGLRKYPAGREASGKWRGMFKAMLVGVGRSVEYNESPLMSRTEKETTLVNDRVNRFRTESLPRMVELLTPNENADIDQLELANDELILLLEDSAHLVEELRPLVNLDDLETAEALGEMSGLVSEMQSLHQHRQRERSRKMRFVA